MGVNFFSAKLDTKGGVGGPRALCLMPQNLPEWFFEYFPKDLTISKGLILNRSSVKESGHGFF